MLVIGDAILDCSVFGAFTHKSAETNINIFKENNVKYSVGGAGNVALNLKAANQNVKFVSVYGMKENSNFVDLHAAVQLSQHHLLKRLSFFHCIFLPPLLKIN